MLHSTTLRVKPAPLALFYFRAGSLWGHYANQIAMLVIEPVHAFITGTVGYDWGLGCVQEDTKRS